MNTLPKTRLPSNSTGYIMLNGKKFPFAKGNFLFLPKDLTTRKRLLPTKNISLQELEQLETAILNLLLKDKNKSTSELYNILYEQGNLPLIAPSTYLSETSVKLIIYRLRRKHKLFREQQTRTVVRLMLQGKDERDLLHTTGVHRETARKIRRALFRPLDRGSITQKFVDGIQKLAEEIRQELENETEKEN